MLPHTHTRLTTCALKNSTHGQRWLANCKGSHPCLTMVPFKAVSWSEQDAQHSQEETQWNPSLVLAVHHCELLSVFLLFSEESDKSGQKPLVIRDSNSQFLATGWPKKSSLAKFPSIFLQWENKTEELGLIELNWILHWVLLKENLWGSACKMTAKLQV